MEREVKLGGKTWIFQANQNGWLSSGPEEAEALVKQQPVVDWGSKGNPVIQDETGRRHTISATRMMPGRKESIGTGKTVREPRMSEATVDELLALKGLTEATKAELQSIKDEWTKLHETELQKQVQEAASRLSLEDMAKLLGLVK